MKIESSVSSEDKKTRRLAGLTFAGISGALSSVALCALSGESLAQNSSLYQRPEPLPAVSPMNGGSTPTPSASSVLPMGSYSSPSNANPFAQSSWTYMPTQQARKLRVHDIVSIRVDEMAQSTAQGNASSRKNTIYDARLSDWVRFDGLSLKPAPQNDGDPRVGGQENEVYRADSTMRTRESVTLNIAAEIADIRPNGNIVLSASKKIIVNDNVFEVTLSGICRSDDIQPDNTILSRNILDMQVTKNDRGHVRDGYSRGWFTKLLARVKPF